MPNFQNPENLEVHASVYDRLKYLLRITRHNQASFGRVIGADPATVSRIMSGKLEPSDGFINRVVVNLHVSKDWLLYGTDVPFPRTTGKKFSKGAPVYNIDVTAGAEPLERMFTEEYVVGYLNLPGINPDLPLVRVSGNSMFPKLMPGAYISIRPVPLDAPISWGSIYVVVLEEFRLVKYLRRNANPELVTLHSENPDYDDIEIPRSDIQNLFLVENVINHESVS